MINPIINWLDEDVWEFIHQFGFKYPSLYDEGFKRLGCIGCPLSQNAEYELERWPKYKQAYIRAFERMLKTIERRNVKNVRWKNGQEVYDWWLRK
jgi:phosphoadenosine phosphosulfate reductase